MPPDAAQNGREFRTNTDEMHLFLGANYMMSICKLPNIKRYLAADDYIDNNGRTNGITRARFSTILQNLYFVENQRADKSDKAYKLQPMINHLKFPADLVTFTKENLNGKLHFLCSDSLVWTNQ